MVHHTYKTAKINLSTQVRGYNTQFLLLGQNCMMKQCLETSEG